MGPITIPLVSEFLLSLFKNKMSSSSINTARSALSFLCGNSVELAENASIKRLFQYFYRKRPRRPKYFVSWPVEKVLTYLKSLFPISSLSLKELTLKTVALIALSCSDRGQTLHLLNVENAHVSKDGITFVINERLKKFSESQRKTLL